MHATHGQGRASPRHSARVVGRGMSTGGYISAPSSSSRVIRFIAIVLLRGRCRRRLRTLRLTSGTSPSAANPPSRIDDLGLGLDVLVGRLDLAGSLELQSSLHHRHDHRRS